MAKFFVSVNATVSTTICIEAETADDAVDAAEGLIWADINFASDIADALSESVDASDTYYWDVEFEGNAPDDEEVANC